MKAGATPELGQKWWSKNKPRSLKSTGLGGVLGSYEKAYKELEKALKSNDWTKIQPALDEVDNYTGKLIPAAVKKAEGMCDKKKHKETLDALGKYPKVIQQQAIKTAVLIKPVRTKIEGGFKNESKRIGGIAESGLKEANKLQDDARKIIGEMDKLVRSIQKSAGKADQKAMQTDADRAKTLMGDLAKNNKRLRDLHGEVRKARREWDYKPGTLNEGGKDPYGKFGDTVMTIEDGIEMKADETEDALKDAMKLENDIMKIFAGEADERELYKKSCARIASTQGKVMATLDAAARTLGGDLGNARSDVINCEEKSSGKEQIDMLKKLAAMTTDYDKKSKKLEKQGKAAKKAIDDELADLPDFVKKDAEFKRDWDRLQEIQKAMGDVAKDGADTVVQSGKFARDVKALAGKLKK